MSVDADINSKQFSSPFFLIPKGGNLWGKYNSMGNTAQKYKDIKEKNDK